MKPWNHLLSPQGTNLGGLNKTGASRDAYGLFPLMDQLAIHTDFLSALIAKSKDPSLLVDQDFMITKSNLAAAVLLGKDAHELTSLPLHTLVTSGIPENGFPQTEPASFIGLCVVSSDKEIPIGINTYPVDEGKSTLVFLKRLQSGEEHNTLALFQEEIL